MLPLSDGLPEKATNVFMQTSPALRRFCIERAFRSRLMVEHTEPSEVGLHRACAAPVPLKIVAIFPYAF